MIIEAPQSMYSRYRVSHSHRRSARIEWRYAEDIIFDGKHHQYHWSLELQFSAITIVRLFATARPRQVIIFA